MSEGTNQFHVSAWANGRPKRVLDLLGAAVALIVLSPVLLLTAVAVRVFLGGPVIYRQARPGRNGQIFEVLKFRSMSDEKDENGDLLPDEVRIGKFGKLLRASSLDELPALWNVLLGEMSLIGPRPLLVEYLPLYSREQSRRHDVRPGITGLAQVNGRNSLSWDEKFRLDILYVTDSNPWLDLRIVLKTIVKVIRRDGISSGIAVGMERFKGNG